MHFLLGGLLRLLERHSGHILEKLVSRSTLSNQRKIGAILGYVNILIKNLVNLAYTPMLLYFIGQDDYGVFQTANSFIFTLSLLSFGFSQAYVRFYMFEAQKEDPESRIKRLNGMYLILYAIICTVVLIAGFLFSVHSQSFFAGSFTRDQLDLVETLMVIMTVSIALTLFSTVFDAYIVAHERFKFQQSRQLLASLLNPVFAFILLYCGIGAVGVALAQLATNVILLLLNIQFAVGKLNMRFSLRSFDKKLFWSIAVFSSWIFVNQVCELANQALPNVILGALSGAGVVAVFAVALQIRSVFYSLSTTISSVFIPLINRIVSESNDNKTLTNLMSKVGKYQAMVYVYVLGGFAVLGLFFIEQWAGKEFGDAYWLVLAMTIPLFIPLVQNTGIEIQRAKNLHKARSIAYFVMAVLNVFLTVVFSSSIGYWAPAVGYIAYCILGCGLFMNWYYHKRIGLNMMQFWKSIIAVPVAGLISCLLCIAGTCVMPVETWASFFVWGVVYTCVYGGVLFAIALNKKERKEIGFKIKNRLNIR